jgi:hypothetical protein
MKLLVVLSRVPYPLEKGDKLRADNLAGMLKQEHALLQTKVSATIFHRLPRTATDMSLIATLSDADCLPH